MATPAQNFSFAARGPIQKAARTANVWGWSYIITIFGAFGAGYVPAGPLRTLLLNFGILCFIIGVLELVWRHKLLATAEARWAKVLAWNQVAGTFALMWSLYLLYQVPDTGLLAYAKKSEMWIQAQPMIRAANGGVPVTDAYALQAFHITKVFCIYGVGGVLILSQIWVVWHYWCRAREIAAAPTPGSVPPVLK